MRQAMPWVGRCIGALVAAVIVVLVIVAVTQDWKAAAWAALAAWTTTAVANRRLSYSIAYKLIRRLARRAGIPAADKISPHSLRHSFATELLGAGVPLQDVQDAMGHADPRTTRGLRPLASQPRPPPDIRDGGAATA